MTFVIHAFGDTNKGLFREVNEDNLMVGNTVFAVADGMGGHAAGEVASEAALGPLRAIDEETYSDPSAATEALAEAVRQANQVVIGKAVEDPDLRGMGTTLTTVMVRERTLHLAHVGDSRAYLLRDGMLEMLTEDHTLVAELVKEGRLTPEQAATHPQRSVITRAIGVESSLVVDQMETPLELRGGDQILLCSDGLTGPVADSLIAEILRTEPDGNIACQRLIDAANASGGPDNITCVLLRVEGDEGPVVAAPAEIPKASHDDDVTAELGDPRALAQAAKQSADTAPPESLDAQRLSELSNGDPTITTSTSPPPVNRRRRVGAIIVGIILILALLAGGALVLVNRQVFIGVDDAEQVGIYRGIQGSVLGWPLFSLVEEQSFELDDLPMRLHQGLESGLSFPSVAAAETHVEQILLPAMEEAEGDLEESDAEAGELAPSPTPEATQPAAPPEPTPLDQQSSRPGSSSGVSPLSPTAETEKPDPSPTSNQ
ncbi:Stp1/IreP family PP2C-type Ser/Thr phosphatase [Euzebya tangerina]|uniref:Stp1/IreP family PP2C-type Ser/Thr phosphatase n=1 Tax=Euzebya tangerina TaxID=591198 RepID=UPI000E3177F2|nr:Stp1/IreP family PP2C-type Ser/Thr phosphatase [Euzebya tangerina]